MIEKQVKCIHCGEVMILDVYDITEKTCSCGKTSHNNGVITEGIQGTDWVDVSPRLLTE